MTGQLFTIPERRHSHLKLAAAITPGTRLRKRLGFRSEPFYPDRARHGKTLDENVATIRSDHQGRQPILGVDPELVVVLETNRAIFPEDVTAAGLTVLELRSDKVLVAFASDPEMTAFLQQSREYQQGSPGLTEKGNEKRALHQRLFDGIDQIRRLTIDDVLSPVLSHIADTTVPGQLVRADIECWSGEVEAEARRRNTDVQNAVRQVGGTVLDTGVRVEAGWSTVCAVIPADRIRHIASLDRVRRMDTAPAPLLSYRQVREVGPHDLPIVLPPAQGAPIVAVIDSGVRSGHPLLAPAVVGIEYVGTGLGDGGDENGHGTLVASLALFGSLEDAIANRVPLQPAGQLLSIRVLDRDNAFSESESWANQLLEALNLAAEAEARVVNLSIGDPRTPFVGPRPTPVAALVDLFARQHPNMVIVISAGNYALIEHDAGDLLNGTYPQAMLMRTDAGLLDPAPAALALTVGALCGDPGQGANRKVAADIKPIGQPGRPSPLTRIGPGPSNMVKPELCAPGGSGVIDTMLNRAQPDSSTSVLGADGGHQDRLLATDAGTSFAAPLVSHAALRVLARYPTLSANAVRALLLLAAEPVDALYGAKPGAKRMADQRRLTGYGQVSAARAEASTDHRAVMVNEAEIRVDDVHLYAIPLPSTCFTSGGTITISASLAYDPPVRLTRLDYFANRIGANLYFGATIADVERAYVDSQRRGELDLEDVGATPLTLSSALLDTQPANNVRSRGAHQVGTYHRSSRFDPMRGSDLIVAVRSVNRWDSPTATQSYAIAVAIERDEKHPALYAELEQQLEALTTIQIEGEAEH